MRLSDDRKKFTLYLHPEEIKSDEQAILVIDSVPRRARGELFRQAFVAGLALHQLDERLPALIATMLTKELTADQVVELIAQTTGWKPSHASIKDVISLTLGERMVVPVGEVLKSDSKQATKEALKVVRKKMSGFV